MLLTYINLATVIAGSFIGLAFGKYFPERIIKLVFQGMSALTIYLGVDMCNQSTSPLIMILSIVIGSIIGELINIEKGISNLGTSLNKRFKSKNNDNFNDGIITAFLLYCIGTMAFLGPLEEGLKGHSDLLLTKSILDGFSSIILCARLGYSVIFSIVPMFVLQGSINLFAQSIHDKISDFMLAEMTALGGILLICLGLNLLEVSKIKVTNMIPGLLVAIILAYFMQ